MRANKAVSAVILGILTVAVLSSDGCGRTRDNRDIAVLAKGNNAFAFDLFSELKEREGNVFFSPHSVSAALAMVYAGARGNTERQMAEVLKFTLDHERIPRAFGRLQTQLNAVKKKGHVELSVASALWAERSFAFVGGFVAQMRRSHGAEFDSVDFQNAPEAARGKINAWAEERTKNRIKELITPGTLDASTRIVLTNIIYFKGDWESQFNAFRTKMEPFRLNQDRSVDVPMMNQTNTFRYMEGDSIQMLELPYSGDDLSMIVLLPREVRGLSQLENSLNVDNLDAWMSRLGEAEVDVALPSFRVTFELDLGDVLTLMGMSDAFSEETADFSGMARRSDGERLYISSVIHEAFADVNERGTEAAATTAVAAEEAILEPPRVFRVDHPFVFLIRHNASGSILFLGRMVDPTNRRRNHEDDKIER